jgi:hypothetical protein
MKLFIRSMVMVLVVTAAMVGVTPVEVPLAPTSPAEARGVGRTPLDDILHWADQKKACGLSRDQLAAIMMAPTYPETGASGTSAPSPMTLSRWDTQTRLYAFEDKATPWQKAFWHPGIGMWQFDSAGFWNLTAASAISTWSSAEQAATTMAQRWCANPSRKHVWGLWYACSSSSICEDIYNFVFDGTKLRNLTTYTTVTREGGMQVRTCRIGTTSTPCYYVDPAKAEGHAGWAANGAGPSPISAPFYVVSSGGREHRFWLSQDTGYPFTIKADKPITGNARTSLVWSTSDALCDVTTGRGNCGSGPRVASTPWGPKSGDPFGSFDTASAGAGSLRLNGWAIDPDVNDPIKVHVFVDWQDRGMYTADISRPDLSSAIPGYGDRHGFSINLGGIGTGAKSICIWAVNVGPYGNSNPLLGCRSATISPNPFGAYDTVAPQGNGVRLTGWTIDADTQDPTPVHVYVDNVYAGQGMANRTRNDVFAVFPWAGPNRGFQIDVNASPGVRNVCAWAINLGPGTHSLLGCKPVLVPGGEPFGAFDSAGRTTGGVRVAGWTIDPDTTGAINVHVYVNGAYAGAYPANKSRPDVGAVYPAFGPNHGFDAVVPAPSGTVQVCVFAINVGAGATNPVLGCRTTA